jgi:hypothetical protein
VWGALQRARRSFEVNQLAGATRGGG